MERFFRSSCHFTQTLSQLRYQFLLSSTFSCFFSPPAYVYVVCIWVSMEFYLSLWIENTIFISLLMHSPALDDNPNEKNTGKNKTKHQKKHLSKSKQMLFIWGIPFLIIRNGFVCWITFGLHFFLAKTLHTKLLNMLICVINTYGRDLREAFYLQWISARDFKFQRAKKSNSWACNGEKNKKNELSA